MDKESIFEGPKQPETVEGGEIVKSAIEQLSALAQSLGFRETEEMVQSRTGIMLAAAEGDYPFDLATEYHLLAETIIEKEGGNSTRGGETRMIALMLQVASIFLEAGQVEYAVEDLQSAVDYTDNRRYEVPELEELGNQIHAIKKTLLG